MLFIHSNHTEESAEDKELVFIDHEKKQVNAAKAFTRKNEELKQHMRSGRAVGVAVARALELTHDIAGEELAFEADEVSFLANSYFVSNGYAFFTNGVFAFSFEYYAEERAQLVAEALGYEAVA